MDEQKIMEMACGRQDMLGCLAMPSREESRARVLHGMMRNAQAVLCFSNELSVMCCDVQFFIDKACAQHSQRSWLRVVTVDYFRRN